MLAGAGTGKGGAETAARPKQGGAPGGSLGKGARPGGRVEVASRGGEAGRRAREEEGDRRLPPPGLAASSRRARPRRPLASLSLSRSPGVRAGLGGPGGARGRAPLPHFSSLRPSSRGRPGAAEPMSGERRRAAGSGARGAEALLPRPRPPRQRQVCAPGVCARRGPRPGRSVPAREAVACAWGSRPRALGLGDGERAGAGWGRGSRLPKMQDGSRAAVQPLVPHHGLHLPAPAQRAPGHPAGPGNRGRPGRGGGGGAGAQGPSSRAPAGVRAGGASEPQGAPHPKQTL